MKEMVDRVFYTAYQESLSYDFINKQYKISNYPDLLRHLAAYELKLHHKKLMDLFVEADSEEAFKEVFIAEAALRYCEIENTSLNYTAFPDSPTNRLYNALFEIIFETRNLAERLNILCPKIKKVLVLECIVTQYQNRHVPLVKAVIKSIDVLKTDAAFTEIIIDGDMVFLVEAAINKRYSHFLRQIYFALQNYKGIYEKLKSHNREILSTYKNIEFINQYLTPRQAIGELRRELIRGGLKVTGNELSATLEADMALYHFYRYLEALPASTKNELMALKDSANVNSVSSTIQYLTGNGTLKCVEQASQMLDTILANPSNRKTLDNQSKIDPSHLQTVICEINTEISNQGNEVSNKLPTKILNPVLENIILYNATALGEFLSHFQAIFFNSILKNLQNIPIHSFYQIKECLFFLEPEQQQAFVETLRDTIKNFISSPFYLGELLSYFDGSYYPELLQKMGTESFQNMTDLNACFKYLSPDQKISLYLAVRKKLKIDAFNLGKLFSYFEASQFQNLVHTMDKIPFKNFGQPNKCLRQFNEEQKISFFNVLKDSFHTYSRSARDLGEFFSHFKPQYYSLLIQNLQEMHFVNFNDFKNFIQGFRKNGYSNEKRMGLFGILRSVLVSVVVTVDDLLYLSKEFDLSADEAHEYLSETLGPLWMQSQIQLIRELIQVFRCCGIRFSERKAFFNQYLGKSWASTYLKDTDDIERFFAECGYYLQNEREEFLQNYLPLDWVRKNAQNAEQLWKLTGLFGIRVSKFEKFLKSNLNIEWFKNLSDPLHSLKNLAEKCRILPDQRMRFLIDLLGEKGIRELFISTSKIRKMNEWCGIDLEKKLEETDENPSVMGLDWTADKDNTASPSTLFLIPKKTFKQQPKNYFPYSKSLTFQT